MDHEPHLPVEALTAPTVPRTLTGMSWKTPLSQRSLGGRVLAGILVLALGIVFVLTQYPTVPNRTLAMVVIAVSVVWGLLAVFRPHWLESWNEMIDTSIRRLFGK